MSPSEGGSGAVRAGSGALVLGWSFLREGAGALLGVGGVEDGPAALEFGGESVGLGQSRGLVHRGLDGLDGERAAGVDLFGDLQRLGERAPVGDDMADQADACGLTG